MHRPPLLRVLGGRPEPVRGVPGPHLIVAADPDRRPGGPHLPEEELRPAGGVARVRRRIELDARSAQVERDRLRRAERAPEHGREPTFLPPQHLHNPRRARTRIPPAGSPEPIVAERGAHLRQLLEETPAGRLVDREVLVVGARLPPVSRDDGAGAQPQQDEREERLDLGLSQAIRRVIASHDLSGGGQRIPLAHHHVGRRDREVAHRVRLDEVAEVHDPHDPTRGEGIAPGRRLRYEDVVVVRVAVDDARPQARQQRSRPSVELRGEALDPLPPRRILHVREILLHDSATPPEVPVQLAPRRGVRKALQGPVDRPEKLSEVAQELPALRPRARERRPGHVGEEPREMKGPVGPLRVPDELARQAGADAREDVAGFGGGEPGQHLVLPLEYRGLLARLRELEHVFRARLRCEVEVLVALARQRACLRANAVQRPRDPGRLRRREARRAVRPFDPARSDALLLELHSDPRAQNLIIRDIIRDPLGRR